MEFDASFDMPNSPLLHKIDQVPPTQPGGTGYGKISRTLKEKYHSKTENRCFKKTCKRAVLQNTINLVDS